ncbi:MAG: LysR family transcriptional regulator [Deltaproteobacteria bacterium]|nr:LysR family transcriptional regulator [Deltaproteobacteria bacterium]
MRLWINWDDTAQLGRGRIELLEAIARSGSISAAARAVGVSYRGAWNWIDRVNRRAAEPLVQTVTGGARGGGARLTPAGEAAVRAYRMLENRVAAALQRVDQDIGRLLAGARAARRRPRVER